MPHCTECNVVLSSLAGLYIHLKIVHQDTNLLFRCKENGCMRPFKGWMKFRRHLLRVHNVPMHSQTTPILYGNVGESHESETEQEETDNDIEMPDSENLENFEKITINCLKDKLLSSSVSFTEKLYSNPKMPRSHIQDVIDSTQDLMLSFSKDLANCVLSSLDESGILTLELKAKIDEICSCLVDPFGSTLCSEYKRLKIIESNPSHVSPLDFVMGDKLDDIFYEGRIIRDRAAIKGKFIPMRGTLNNFFTLPGVVESVFSYVDFLEKERQSGIISNFMQADLWQQKLEHFHGKTVLPLFVYFDDFEVNNPLGSHAGVSKLGAVYFSLPFLPPDYRSKLENIFLTLLFYTSDRSHCGNKNVFQILVDEINYLQREGITVKLPNGEVKRIHFALGLVLGDNLGMNSVLGFIESFGANFYCRFCKMHRTDAQRCCVEDKTLLRSETDYDRDGFNNSASTGIKENSVWNSILFFHVLLNFVCDIMHDLLEGVCKYSMTHILDHYINKKKLFTLDDLNSRLKTFNYTVNNIRNRPPLLTARDMLLKRIPYSSSEMHSFMLIFPVIVSDLITINPNDEVWSYFLILREILDIVFAKSFDKESLELLDNLVYQHHRLYLRLFEDTLKAKFHFMTHYKLICQMAGPLSHLSSMRFESKHRSLKVVAAATCSRLNIIHTISLREQMIVSHRINKKRGLEVEMEMGPAERLGSPASIDSYYLFRDTLPLQFRGPCIEVSWVKVKGIQYRIGTCVALDHVENGNIIFGLIHHILISETGDITFVCNETDTVEFDRNIHAFVIRRNDWKYSCKSVSSLLNPFPVIHHKMSSGKNVVILKHSI